MFSAAVAAKYTNSAYSILRPKDGEARATGQPFVGDEGIRTVTGSHRTYDRVSWPQNALRSARRLLLRIGRDCLDSPPLRIREIDIVDYSPACLL